MIKFPSSPPRTGPLRLPDERPSALPSGAGGGGEGLPGEHRGPCPVTASPPAPAPSPRDGSPPSPPLAGLEGSQLQGLEGAQWTPPLSSASGTACQGLLPSGCQQGPDAGALWNQDSGHPDRPELGQTQASSPASRFPPLGSPTDQSLDTARPGSRSCRLACQKWAGGRQADPHPGGENLSARGWALFLGTVPPCDAKGPSQ